MLNYKKRFSHRTTPTTATAPTTVTSPTTATSLTTVTTPIIATASTIHVPKIDFGFLSIALTTATFSTSTSITTTQTALIPSSRSRSIRNCEVIGSNDQIIAKIYYKIINLEKKIDLVIKNQDSIKIDIKKVDADISFNIKDKDFNERIIANSAKELFQTCIYIRKFFMSEVFDTNNLRKYYVYVGDDRKASNTKFEEVSEWKKLPVIKECYKNIFKPIDEKDPETTYMSCIIDKVWGESCDVLNVHVAWIIHVVKTIKLSQTQLKLRKIGVESSQILIFTTWVIAITQIILNPNNCYVKITEDIIKEKYEENLFKLNNEKEFCNFSDESENESPPLSPSLASRNKSRKNKKSRVEKEITFLPLEKIRENAEILAIKNMKKRSYENEDEEENNNEENNSELSKN
ncbi:hypothetical protein Glove_194g5 [Diversispora epigaea]|uniref:Uncharacterized protein n=1 Tax=Diversispora epigaea TaxID=1348612 RepID=A0A397IUB7_9GLOM|nr:hypothetical protein Glove_194g5 [Diversispora epigaea]